MPISLDPRSGAVRIGGIRLPVEGKLPLGCSGVFALPFVLVALVVSLFALAAGLNGEVVPVLGFAAAACLIGGIGMAPLYFLLRTRRRLEGMPGEAWRVREEWATNTVAAFERPSKYRIGVVGMLFGGMMNLVGWSVAIKFTILEPPAHALLWSVWLFPLVALAFVAPSVYGTFRRFRRGRYTFEMESAPGEVGGEVRGTVRGEHVERSLLGQAVTMRLGCYERYVTFRKHSEGKAGPEIEYDEVWSSETRVDVRNSGRRRTLAVPVAFDVPPGLAPSPIRKAENRIVWRLDVAAGDAGGDVVASFEIPVFDETREEASLEDPGLTKDTVRHEAVEADEERFAEVNFAEQVWEDEGEDAPEATERASEFGPEAWLRRKAWQSARIEAERDRKPYSLVMVAVAWLAITGFLAYLFASGIGEGGSVGLFVVFGLIGLGLLGLGLRHARKQRRYRGIVLELDEVPGTIGGTIGGRVETKLLASKAPSDGFLVRLGCYHRHLVSDSDGGRNVVYAPIWFAERRMQGQSYGDGKCLAVPFFFDVPSDQPESTPTVKQDRIVWRIEVSAQVGDGDFRSTFEVPVFVVEGRYDGGAPRSTYADAEFRRTFAEPDSPGITMAETAGAGLRFDFGPARATRAAIHATIGLLFLASLLVLIAWLGGFGLAALIESAIILVPLFILTALMGRTVWSYWTHASSVTVEGGEVVVESGTFGRGEEEVLPCAKLVMVEVEGRIDGCYDLNLVWGEPGDELREAVRQRAAEQAEKIGRGMRTGGAANRKRRGGALQALIERRNALGDKVNVAKVLPDREEAEWIAARIEEAAWRQALVQAKGAGRASGTKYPA